MRSWDDNDLIEAVRNSDSYTDVMLKLGITPQGRNGNTIKKHISRLNLNISHMKHGSRRIPQEKVFIENSRASNTTVRGRVRREKLIKYVCDECGNTGVYNNKPLTLQLDHHNGIRNDHRISNLRWLCPNCHSQTPTFARTTNPKTVKVRTIVTMVHLKCDECKQKFDRPKRQFTNRLNKNKNFCSQDCAHHNQSRTAIANKHHKKIYADFLKTRKYLTTAKKFSISDKMVKKIVNKFGV
jgi:DNA-directed RNA polymerase subunit RPC12/RpoP